MNHIEYESAFDNFMETLACVYYPSTLIEWGSASKIQNLLHAHITVEYVFTSPNETVSENVGGAESSGANYIINWYKEEAGAL